MTQQIIPPTTLLRRRGGHESGKVGYVELFFDLVFVFAITQISHALLHDLTWMGALRAGLVLGAVWWGWVYTAWVTNWLDPERIPVRLCLFVLMLVGLAMSSAIPGAFEGRGLAFALAYALLQLGRTGFTLWALRHAPTERRHNFQRIFTWLALGAVFWVIGGLMPPGWREATWLLALIIEFCGPFTFYWTPGLGRSRLADWDVDGSHMAERCALFVIIALGESLLVSGATFGAHAWDGPAILAFLSTFLGTVGMWWLYFHKGAERAHHRILSAADPGRLARLAYTYIHLIIVAGIILTAVADDLVLAHPGDASDRTMLTILLAPTVYLAGTGLFKMATTEPHRFPLSHIVGLFCLAAMVAPAFGGILSGLSFGFITSIILIIVAAWEHISLTRPEPIDE